MTQYTYYPNESVRITASLTVLGIVETPVALTLFVTDPDGNVTSYANDLTPDSPGNYHQDITMGPTPALGRWSYYWTSVGSQPNQQGVSAPSYFYVAATGQP
jgi:hypothetical protein